MFSLSQDPEAAATQNPELSEYLKQKHLVNFLQEAVQFASIFDQALPVVCTLLGSKQVGLCLICSTFKANLE
jgi:hypothetical protein